MQAEASCTSPACQRVKGLWQDGACRNAVTHCPGWAHRHQLYCAHTAALEAFCLLLRESKGDKEE